MKWMHHVGNNKYVQKWEKKKTRQKFIFDNHEQKVYAMVAMCLSSIQHMFIK